MSVSDLKRERRAYDRLNLETGAMPEFAPARALYTPYGFEYRGLFAEYIDDPNSVFMKKKLKRRFSKINPSIPLRCLQVTSGVRRDTRCIAPYIFLNLDTTLIQLAS